MKDYDHLPPVVRHLRQRWRTWRLSWRNARRAFRPGEVCYHLAIGRFGGCDMAYRRHTADEKVIAQSFDQDMFFAGLPEYQPRPDHVICDIGAHIGAFTVLAARRVPQGRVYAIEASRETCDYLRINVALNHLTNVVTSHLALMDRQGTVRLHHDDANWGHTVMRGLYPTGEDVPADTLAHYFLEQGIEHCDFMKFNCEGAEFPILLGTDAEVLRRIEFMLILFHCDLAKSYTVPALRAHLEQAGFHTLLRRCEEDRGWIIARRTVAPDPETASVSR
ncbi:MAG: FkbM family methyltransferase [Magnetococcus sp. DMHC-8]